MTDKERIICKYKFQDKEKFDGKPYCTCFNELCEDLTFVCDHNCQIYEDYKQLARKTQECEKLKKEIINKDEKIKELRFSVSDLTNRLCYLNAEKSFRIVDLEQALDEIAAHYQKVIKNITNYDDSYDASISIKALHNISDIINKAKENK